MRKTQIPGAVAWRGKSDETGWKKLS